MQVFDNIISDRGSKYAVAGGPCRSEAEAKAFLKVLKRRKKFAKATHNSWGLLTSDGPVKNDDGEVVDREGGEIGVRMGRLERGLPVGARARRRVDEHHRPRRVPDNPPFFTRSGDTFERHMDDRPGN